ncbi:MAG: GtrA family protein [Acutalibacteraceae bacterium]|jgi:putative flippase GtrA|nr:GtrA family protein [Clostridia bacterium]MEE1283355.1 GtrA family protein [Acutalibacteraceae bacterium]
MAQEITKKQTLVQTVKFAAFSMGAGVIQTVTFTLLNEVAHLNYWAAYLPALVLSVLFNFTVNRKFTFKSAANVPVAMLKVAGFYCVFTPLSTWGGEWLDTWLKASFPAIASWNEYIVLALTMVLNLVTEYLFCRFFVYRNNMYTNAEGIKEQEKIKHLKDED